MIRKTKKQEILKLIKKYKHLLGFKDYRLSIQFVKASEDRDLIGNHGIMSMSSVGKNIYIRLSEIDCKRMQLIQLKRLIIHELLHGFFWDISNLFDKVVDKNVQSAGRNKMFKRRFDIIEENNVNHLVEAFIRIEKKSKLEQKEKLEKLIKEIPKKI